MKKSLFVAILFVLSFSWMQAQIVNKGTLKIKAGTTVYFANNYTNDGTHNNDGDLYVTGDFTNNGTTTSASGTTYFKTSSAVTQNLNGSSNAAQFYNLTVDNTTASANGLSVADAYNLQVDNALALTNGKLRLMGEAQLVQTHTGTTNNTGSGHLLKDQDGAQNAYRYNYWSSPVQNDAVTVYNVSTVLKDGTTANQWSPTQVGFTAALNGTNGNPVALSTRWMWKYIDSSVNPYNDQDWVQLFDMGTINPSSGANISPAQGFIMKGTNAAAAYAATQNYSFEGKPNDGLYTLQISNNKEYLVGNPYPSALDANQFLSDNNASIDGVIYFWEHWSTNTHVYSDYGGGYIMYTPGSGANPAVLHGDFAGGANDPSSGIVGILPDNYKIPVAQGFLVRSTSITTGSPTTITFKNSQRVYYKENTTDNSSVFVRESPIFRIRLGYESPNTRHRFLLLAFTQNGTNSYDNGYDGQMIDIGPDDMYFTMEDEGRNLGYAIQGVGPYDEEAAYPFTLKVTTPGEHRIMIDALENFTQPVYILDKEVNTTYEITEDTDFTINLDSGLYANRFEVVFQPQAPLEVENYLNDMVHAFYANEELVIQKDSEVALTGIQVYNSIGQLVYELNNPTRLSMDEIRIPFVFAQAAYVLKIQAKKGRGTYKFVNY